MSEFAPSEIPHALADQPPDFGRAIACLRQAGVGQFDPVRLHYLEVLARRAQDQQGPVQRILEDKLAQALAALAARFEQAQGQARDRMARITPQYPQAADELRRLYLAGDFRGLERCTTTLKTSNRPTPLGDLARAMAQVAPDKAEGHGEGYGGSRPELKTMRYFRNTWSKLSVEKQVTQALGQAPKNAGPINSHMLVVRSLALMREISPDYLNRYISYVDTLLCLDQSDKKSKPLPKKPPVVKTAKR
ncbi:MAG: hypothetical protein A3F78_02475 [Burkholderiales bacterium RIFCSPLOWO2_12_FULL_61_40]|nr:MAG: hypothetical protein A3F78_02475 [Burkholderiales bacterium RIFCSPLOWO2_12_FULL_61_40]